MLNPIFALEVRARWRSNRSFLLLLGVALALSLVAGFIYQRAVVTSGNASFNPMSGAITPALTSGNARAGAVGRELFLALAHANILVWLLLAAASSATGIAREREQGLLESLQLSHISASGQIAARLGAGLLLLGALQLVLLPIYSVAFFMGGISPAEVAQAFWLVMWSAIIGTSLGLWFSARSHRPPGALFGALGAIALFSTLVYFNNYDSYWGFVFDMTWPGALLLFHPNAFFHVANDSGFVWLIDPQRAWLMLSAAYLAVSGSLLWSAMRNVNRPLAAPSWQSNAAWVEKLRRKQLAAQGRSKVKQRASGAMLADLPLDRFVRFSDPLLAREVKSRFRLRRAGWGVGLVRFALFLLAAGVWLFEVFWLFDPYSREAMVPYGLRALLYGGTLCLGVLAATSWTRERESGTWEALKLSLMSPREILRAKWLSPLVSFAYYSAPLWILLPLGAFYVPFVSFVEGALVVAAWLGLAVALGLWMSWRVRNGSAAIAWTAGLLMGLLVAAPWLSKMAGVDESLASWRYGVGGWRDESAFYPFSRTQSSEEINRRYQAATGRRAPLPVPLPRPGQVYTFGAEWQSFQRWGAEQVRDAETFKARLKIWHPGELLNRLFAESDDKNLAGYRRNDRTSYQPEDFTVALASSALAPLALTVVLLLLLRRDVKREQLNA